MGISVEESKVEELTQPALDAVLEENAQRGVVLERALRGAPRSLLPVHHENPWGRQMAVDARDVHRGIIGEIALEISQVVRLLDEIELLQELLGELVDEQGGGASDVLAAPVVEDALRGGSQDPQVQDDLRPRPRPEDLHRHLRAVHQRRLVHLPDGSRRDGLRRDHLEHLGDGPPEVLLHDLERLGGWKRRHAILQLGQLLHHLLLHEVRAVRQVLAELDEQGSEGRERVLELGGVTRASVLRVEFHERLLAGEERGEF